MSKIHSRTKYVKYLGLLIVLIILMSGYCFANSTMIICGNGVCEPAENSDNCPDDCGSSYFEYSLNSSSDLFLKPNATKSIELVVRNIINNTQLVNIQFRGPIYKYFTSHDESFYLTPHQSNRINLNLTVPDNVSSELLHGYLIIKSNYSSEKKFFQIKIEEGNRKMRASVDMVDDVLEIDENLSFEFSVYPPLQRNKSLKLLGSIYYNDLNQKIYEFNLENPQRTNAYTYGHSEDLWDTNISLQDGTYMIVLTGHVAGENISTSTLFTVDKPMISSSMLTLFVSLGFLLVICTGGFFAYKSYKRHKLSKMRYIFPDFRKLPKGEEGSFWLGKIAETNKTAYFNPSDLTTHALVSGSTGSGKSVTASVLVEEALLKNKAVVVFDPTSQWTGFVKRCKDKNILKYYKEFNMSEEEATSFRGLIYNVESPEVNLDIKKYLNPGEVTVFNLANLKPGQYDLAVQSIVDIVFSLKWEENPELQMVFVFDEVHRLLEKYGGSGGYKALEKACREFRKWGIGMVMVSQVSADFKEAVAGNILTEIQLNTKSMEDIKKISQKHGPEYSSKVTRQGIGVGMVQNAKHNDGKPYFVHFRPTLHDPHNLPEQELNKYMEYSERLNILEFMLNNAKEQGEDVQELQAELNMTKKKLKEGNFRMVDMYLKTLSENLSKLASPEVQPLFNSK